MSGSRQQSWQKKKASAGLCIFCGANPLITSVRCQPCRLAHNAAELRRYYRQTRPQGNAPEAPND